MITIAPPLLFHFLLDSNSADLVVVVVVVIVAGRNLVVVVDVSRGRGYDRRVPNCVVFFLGARTHAHTRAAFINEQKKGTWATK